ncbi:MAG: VanR-ABDEGLN family response regulator transcription factor [Lachnospiraceae bacterium]|nr:VanR-ABDEGLN family response regulator transcription factor [Lachnospiraceae bacterium]
MTMNILVVDDEKEIADLIGIYLQNEGYNVITCGRAAGVMDIVERENISLAILDVMLPDGDGMELLREIRREHYFPVIMLTAKIRDTDKITGLTLGADDYITKPFNPLELMARVKTQLRRYTRYNVGGAPEEAPSELTIRGLTIDRDTHKARLNGSELVLTPMEFSILRYLCEHRGKVVSSEELYEKVWGEEFLDCNNTVMAHIARLRSKMKEPARHPRYIKTVWGVGYTIE